MAVLIWALPVEQAELAAELVAPDGIRVIGLRQHGRREIVLGQRAFGGGSEHLVYAAGAESFAAVTYSRSSGLKKYCSDNLGVTGVSEICPLTSACDGSEVPPFGP